MDVLVLLPQDLRRIEGMWVLPIVGDRSRSLVLWTGCLASPGSTLQSCFCCSSVMYVFDAVILVLGV